MIEIVVKQGSNRIENVYVDENDLGVISVVINYEKRWCAYTIGSSSGGVNDARTEDFYIYDPSAPDLEPNASIVEIHHTGELDNMHQVTNQEKDQLYALYMPYIMVEDGHVLAEWEGDNEI